MSRILWYGLRTGIVKSYSVLRFKKERVYTFKVGPFLIHHTEAI